MTSWAVKSGWMHALGVTACLWRAASTLQQGVSLLTGLMAAIFM